MLYIELEIITIYKRNLKRLLRRNVFSNCSQFSRFFRNKNHLCKSNKKRNLYFKILEPICNNIEKYIYLVVDLSKMLIEK